MKKLPISVAFRTSEGYTTASKLSSEAAFYQDIDYYTEHYANHVHPEQYKSNNKEQIDNKIEEKALTSALQPQESTLCLYPNPSSPKEEFLFLRPKKFSPCPFPYQQSKNPYQQSQFCYQQSKNPYQQFQFCYQQSPKHFLRASDLINKDKNRLISPPISLSGED